MAWAWPPMRAEHSHGRLCAQHGQAAAAMSAGGRHNLVASGPARSRSSRNALNVYHANALPNTPQTGPPVADTMRSSSRPLSLQRWPLSRCWIMDRRASGSGRGT